MEIPWQRLESDTLRRVIEEFITREGTDYGHREIGLEDKVRQVLRQLSRKEALLVFDPELGSCHIVPAHSFKQEQQGEEENFWSSP